MQVSELSDIKTYSDRLSDVMAKTIAAVRDVIAFRIAYRNPSKQLQDRNSNSRAFAFNAHRAALRTDSSYQAKKECMAYCVRLLRWVKNYLSRSL